MSSIILRKLTLHDENAFLQGLKLWKPEDLEWYSFIWNQKMTYQQMLIQLEHESQGINLEPGRVPHTMLYAFLNDIIIGRASIRHKLNDQLQKRGGHLGYAIAENFRKQGHGIEIARQSVKFCKEIGLKEILITCAESNTASWKIIEHFNFKLQDCVWDDGHQEMIKRYWVTID